MAPRSSTKSTVGTVAATVDVVDITGKKVGSVDLPAEWFAGDVNIPVMHQVVTAQLAAARQGTHKTKTRGEVSGGGRKPWKQKGTGRARQGSTRSPQWIGGGVSHGRVPKDWSQRVNRKMRRSALRSALTDRLAGGNIIVVDRFAFDGPRTKDAVAALDALGVGQNVLLVLADFDESAVLSVRNLGAVHTLLVDQLNTHDVLLSDTVIIEEAAIGLIGTGTRSGDADIEIDIADDGEEDGQ
jgi:large subunit ribosomal protein L4